MRNSLTGTALLKTGTIIGDVRYMSDEQLQGKAVFASDLYSLGLTCLHLLTNVNPWELFDTSEGEWVWRHYLIAPISEELRQILEDKIFEAEEQWENSPEILTEVEASKKAYQAGDYLTLEEFISHQSQEIR